MKTALLDGRRYQNGHSTSHEDLQINLHRGSIVSLEESGDVGPAAHLGSIISADLDGMPRGELDGMPPPLPPLLLIIAL